jgi:hypothetical protein
MSGNAGAYVWIREVKTIFAYETFQEIVYHLLFVLDSLYIAYLGAIFSQLQFISKLRSAAFIVSRRREAQQ